MTADPSAEATGVKAAGIEEHLATSASEVCEPEAPTIHVPNAGVQGLDVAGHGDDSAAAETADRNGRSPETRAQELPMATILGAGAPATNATWPTDDDLTAGDADRMEVPMVAMLLAGVLGFKASWLGGDCAFAETANCVETSLDSWVPELPTLAALGAGSPRLQATLVGCDNGIAVAAAMRVTISLEASPPRRPMLDLIFS
mmetsp:Transcript_98502/g.246827  ORF Transcript_98502/g.246827 Transcript_98502/m.246827 type:complete len:202 (-) Transcript_98502:281-886(-)